MHISSTYGPLLRRFLGPQKGAVATMSLLLVASIGMQLAGPQVARGFIDAARAGAAERALIQAALLFLGVSIAQQVLRVLAAYWSERVAWTATNALRADLTAHLLRLDRGFHNARTPGELIERVDGDVNALGGFFSQFVVQLLGSLLLLIGVLGALYLVDVRLGLAFSVFATITLGALGWVRNFGTADWGRDRQQSATYYGFVGEVLAATEDLRSSAATSYVMRRFFELRQRWLPIVVRAELWGTTIWIVAAGLFAVGDALAYGLGGSLYRSATISLGAVYLVVAYTAMLAAPIETIRVQLQDLQRADASVVRVRELLAYQSNITDGSALLQDGALAVAFDDVRFAYQDGESEAEQPVLDQLSFQVEAGRMLGLLGRTGSGKTTIARLLFRLYDPQAGQICVGGLDLRDTQRASLRARVGMVTQDVQIFEATLRDNLTFFDTSVPDDRLVTVLDELGLGPWLQRLPAGLDTAIAGSRLSAGEAQLVALARVFLKDPGLVILDEASSKLDPATEAMLDGALLRLLAGRTVIIIAHRLKTIERADDLLILEQGQIVEYGSRTRLMADPSSRLNGLHRAGIGEVLV